MAPAKFASLVRTFGPLPEEGIHQLAAHIVPSVCRYRLQQQGTRLPAPAKQSELLERIANHAEQLLTSMGIADPQAVGLSPIHAPAHLSPTVHMWLFVELYRIATERRPTTATFTANERMTFLLVLLSDLAASANRCAGLARKQSIRTNKRSKGGKGREGTTPVVTLLYALFETYAILRRQYPQCANPPTHRRRGKPHNGDPTPACDARLKAFVRAGLALAVSIPPAIVAADGKRYESAEKIYGTPDLAKRTTDPAIRGAFYRWQKSQSKAQNAIDLRITPSDQV
jgi:hypothetical protein